MKRCKACNLLLLLNSLNNPFIITLITMFTDKILPCNTMNLLIIEHSKKLSLLRTPVITVIFYSI